MTPYPVPEHRPESPLSCEQVIKKSRFITLLAHTTGIEEAKAFVELVRRAHPAARHHCWAHVAGAPTDSLQYGFSDDGEPSGTAGKPILAQLMGSGIGEITAVVVRYSGGIKLGTGGLVKAYGGGVQQALPLLQTRLQVAMTRLSLSCSYQELAPIERLIEQQGGQMESADYSAEIKLVFAVDSRLAETLAMQIFEMTRGQISPCVIKD